MRHVFSLASVRTVQHWFQAIRGGQLRCFDAAPGNSAPAGEHTVTPGYPISSIGSRTRILCLTGEQDTVLDLPRLRSMLPSHAGVLVFPEYEHLCVLWGAAAAAGPSTPHCIALRFLWECGGGREAGCLDLPGEAGAAAAKGGLVALAANGWRGVTSVGPWVPGWTGDKVRVPGNHYDSESKPENGTWKGMGSCREQEQEQEQEWEREFARAVQGLPMVHPDWCLTSSL